MVNDKDQLSDEQSDESQPLKPRAEQKPSIAGRVRQQATARAKKKVEQATKKAIKKAVVQSTKVAVSVVTKHPVVLGLIGAVVIFIILISLIFVSAKSCSFAGVTGKVSNEAGGSMPIGLNPNNQLHKQLVDDVVELTQGDSAVLISDNFDLNVVLDWSQDEDGRKFHELDWRVMEALRYLGGSWRDRGQGKIGISILKDNGPSMTRRKVFQDLGNDEAAKLLDAPSSYSFGQAVGIDKIGLTSPAHDEQLTYYMCLAGEIPCPPSGDCHDAKSVPVKVEWQLVTSERFIRPLYEQIEVDAAELYNRISGIMENARIGLYAPEHFEALDQSHRVVLEAGTEDVFTLALQALDNLVVNLEKLSGVDGMDDRTLEFAARALGFLADIQATLLELEAQEGTGFMEEWAKEETEKAFREGIYYVFKTMQVANMVGWRGNRNLTFWKAYEARQNIRQLVLDLLRMPIELVKDDPYQDFDMDLIVRQLITYGSEDDLDNNLPDLDVYPDGAVAVSEGGVAFGPREGYETIGDGVDDVLDLHFSSLPIDNGVFSKACTVFIYKTMDSCMVR